MGDLSLWSTTSPLHFFTDPVLRAPTIGCMLMCLTSALVGTLTFIKQRSLLGESLAHASYPGVILVSMVVATLFPVVTESITTVAILIGAFLTSILGLWVIDFLQNRAKVTSDAALCFVLSSFFGVGITMASRFQFTHTELYRRVQSYLYGQAATMTDVHIYLYGSLAIGVICLLLLLYKELQVSCFDRAFADSIGVRVKLVDTLILILAVVAIVIGIRSVGFVLISAMLIAPAAAARQFSHKLHRIFILSAFFGMVSGFFGVYFSVILPQLNLGRFSLNGISLPTGPMIVLVASSICFLSLLLAPDRGMVQRMFRAARFRWGCAKENLLKGMWRLGEESEITFAEVAKSHPLPRWVIWWTLRRLLSQGWISRTVSGGYVLTKDGRRKGAHIVRLHRLWEVYLADDLGVGVERVHRSAEEMEHIITPELEQKLTELLDDPKEDPHRQPIPPHGEML